MRRAVVIAGALVGAAAQAPGYTTQCNWAAQGSSWDLSSMTLQGQTYNIVDMRDSSISYVFNLCSDTTPPQPQSGACTRLGGANALAWQVDQPEAGSSQWNCYRLGWQQAYGWNFTFADPARPARGVVITYPGGESTWCDTNRSRTFSVELQCAPVTPSATTYSDASVFELNTCDYRMQLKSIAGCPRECITGGSICSNNGVCGYNTDAGRSQCFCNTGFSGSTCGSPSGSGKGLSAEGIILIIVCLVLASVIGLVAFMFIKLRKLQVDPSAYGQLEGKFNELGMLA